MSPAATGLATILTLGSLTAAHLSSYADESAAGTSTEKAKTRNVPTMPSVKFVTYNLRNYFGQAPEESGSVPKGEKEKEALVSILTKIGPDVLGVCEMGQKSDLEEFQSRLKQAGLDLPHTEYVQGADGTRHVALLSRFPISHRQSRTDARYVIGRQEFAMQRGILDVTVDVAADCSIQFVGVHLKSRREVTEADQSLMRREEAHLVRMHLDEIFKRNSSARVLLYGDFNSTKDDATIREIAGIQGTESFMIELPAEDKDGLRWTYYYEPADDYSRIDYVFRSKALAANITSKGCTVEGGESWQDASDHRPVSILINPTP